MKHCFVCRVALGAGRHALYDSMCPSCGDESWRRRGHRAAQAGRRADVPGAPRQYGTTKDFLDRFGLMSLDDLPRDAELAKD